MDKKDGWPDRGRGRAVNKHNEGIQDQHVRLRQMVRQYTRSQQ